MSACLLSYLQVGVFLAIFTPTSGGHCPYAAFCGIPTLKVGVFFAFFTLTFHLRIGKRTADAPMRR